MCEGRTIGPNTDETQRTLELEHGAVLHNQISFYNNFQLKQAWCQIGELVQKGQGAILLK